jgi:predicted nucleotide-binding protein
MKSPNQQPKVEDPRLVFVVHGRDEKIRKDMFTFLRSIGLKPLEWSQVVEATGKTIPYVGEILDTAFSKAQAVVVLMTPDDEACLRSLFRKPSDPDYEITPTPQARPNVLFEAGMAIGRSPERTILVEVGVLRPFSDVGGRLVIKLDNSTQKRQELAQRLGNAGCPVDLSGTDWHTTGDFAIGPELEYFPAIPAKGTVAIAKPVAVSSELPEEQNAIIKALAQRNATGSFLNAVFTTVVHGYVAPMSLLSLNHLLRKMREAGYIFIYNQGSPVESVTLTDKGIEYAVEHGFDR